MVRAGVGGPGTTGNGRILYHAANIPWKLSERVDPVGDCPGGIVLVAWTGGAQGAEEIRAIDNDPNNPAVLAQYDRFDNSSTFIGNPANWPAGPPTNNPASPYVWSGVGRVVPGALDLVTRATIASITTISGRR